MPSPFYKKAKIALEKCSRIDECADWANKAEALASYARQSKDSALRKMADRIQARAIRRCGELLRQVESQQGKRTDRLRNGTDTKSQMAAKAGLSRRQKVTALRLANVPTDEFEAAIESDEPPTVTALAERGKGKIVKPHRGCKATINVENFHKAAAKGSRPSPCPHGARVCAGWMGWRPKEKQRGPSGTRLPDGPQEGNRLIYTITASHFHYMPE